MITLLSGMGILRCGHCGGAMTSFSKQGKIRYMCESGKKRMSSCRAWSVSGVLVERCLLQPLITGYISLVMDKQDSEQSISGLIDSKRGELEAIQSQIDNTTTAISMGGNLGSLVAMLQGFESRKSTILVALDKLTQRELLQGSRDQQIEKIVDTMILISPELLEDTTDPDRLNIREVVRAVIDRVTISKGEDKVLRLVFDGYDHQRFIFQGEILADDRGRVSKGYSLHIEDRNVEMNDGIEPALSLKFGELIKAQHDKVDEIRFSSAKSVVVC